MIGLSMRPRGLIADTLQDKELFLHTMLNRMALIVLEKHNYTDGDTRESRGLNRIYEAWFRNSPEERKVC